MKCNVIYQNLAVLYEVTNGHIQIVERTKIITNNMHFI